MTLPRRRGVYPELTPALWGNVCLLSCYLSSLQLDVPTTWDFPPTPRRGTSSKQRRVQSSSPRHSAHQSRPLYPSHPQKCMWGMGVLPSAPYPLFLLLLPLLTHALSVLSLSSLGLATPLDSRVCVCRGLGTLGSLLNSCYEDTGLGPFPPDLSPGSLRLLQLHGHHRGISRRDR